VLSNFMGEVLIYQNTFYIQLMASARHKSLDQAMQYKKDAHTLLHFATNSSTNVCLSFNDLSEVPLIVSTWKSIYLESIQLARDMNSSNTEKKDLATHAEDFFKRICITSTSIVDILRATLDFQYALSTRGKYNSFIITKLNYVRNCCQR